MDSTTTQSPSVNQTTPAAPRKHFTPEQRQALLERFHESGLTQPEFVAAEGFSKATLSKWLKHERRRAREQAPAKAPAFQELRLEALSSGCALEVSSPKNWTLRLAQPPAAAVLQQLI